MSTSNPAKWILLVTLASGFYCVGAAGLAQLNWELWVHVGRTEFEVYHLAWWHGIWWAIFPVAAVALLGSFAELKWRPIEVPAWSAWLGVIIQVVTYVLTALWWGPGQAQLTQTHMENGSIDPHYYRLVTTNWLRVALITFFGILQLWMVARAFISKSVDQNSGMR